MDVGGRAAKNRRAPSRESPAAHRYGVMHAFPKRLAAIILLTALVVRVIARGIVPAMTDITSDFPSYFTAAKIVLDGGSVERLYEIPWFQEQMRRYGVGIPSEGKFSPFPPPTALLYVPLARLEPLVALRVVTAVSTLGLLVSIVMLARVLGRSMVDAGLLVLLSGSAILTALRLGQPYILVSTSCILGYYAFQKERPGLSGACLGLFTPLKYYPVIYLIYFGVRRCWRLVAGGVATVLAVTVASVGVLGWKLHAEFLRSVLGGHLVGRLTMQDPFTASFQSFDSLYRRLFVLDATANPHPLVVAPWLHGAGVAVTKSAIALVTIATLVRLARNRGAALATAPSLGVLGIVTLLLAPATATYHLILLWLPIGLLVDFFLRERATTCAYVVLSGYALIGFFPYWLTKQFEGRGGLTLIAYPRLFLLLAMFLVCVHCLWTRAAAGSPRTATVHMASTGAVPRGQQ